MAYIYTHGMHLPVCGCFFCVIGSHMQMPTVQPSYSQWQVSPPLSAPFSCCLQSSSCRQCTMELLGDDDDDIWWWRWWWWRLSW